MASKTSFKSKIKASIIAIFTLLLVSLPGIASASLCDDISKGTGGFFSCGTETTTFTSFQGGLTAPETAGYSPGLTQATNVRDYIKNVVNFALGFLGILAVVIIIFGGFMYLTAAGKEETATKGKKTVTYAIIGLLIIMASFAIVNTVLQAPSGTEGQPLAGSATGVTSTEQNAARQAAFNYAGTVVQTVARDFVTAYQNYSEIATDIQNLTNIDVMTSVGSAAELQSLLSNMKNTLTNIVSKAGALSQVAETGNAAIVSVNAYLQLKTPDLNAVISATDKDAWTKFWSGANPNALKTLITVDINDPLTTANEKDFGQAVKQAYDKIKNLKARIKQVALLQDVDPLFNTVLEDFQKLFQALGLPAPATASLTKLLSFLQVEKANAQAIATPKKVTNESVLKIVNDLGALYDKVKSILFVYTVITADATEGNAPMIVNVDGLKSLDPNNKTIPDANYKWNFGDLDSGAAENEKTGAAQTHVYNKVGTYVIQLSITAANADTTKGETQPAPGLAYQTITVKPPASNIYLKATSTTFKDYYLSKFDPTTRQQIINNQELVVLTTEAKSPGISFDAKETQTFDGQKFSNLNNTTASKVSWDFGDKSDKNNIKEGMPDEIGLSQVKMYQNPGSYRVIFEVTDKRGVTDRKIVNVIVVPLAARITVQPESQVFLGQEVTYDGSSSASATGQIKSFKWELTDVSAQNAVNPPVDKDGNPFKDSGKDTLKFAFSKPGDYAAKLTVDDGTAQNSTTVQIHVISKPPIAQFTFDNPDSTHPNLYTFDGTPSYDPDGTPDEQLKYKWEANPPDCVYFKMKADGTGFEDGSGTDCSQLGTEGDKGYNSSNGRLRIKFNTAEKYTVTLDVQDPADPGNSVPQNQDLTVDNILDVGWGDDGKPLTAQLRDGKANVTFQVKSENGVAFQIETGDNKKENGNLTNGAGSVTHEYTQAGALKAKLTVYDAQDNGNSIVRKVFIGSADTPIAAISLQKDSEDVIDTSGVIMGNRKTVFTFDGSKSLNVDGSGRNLNYSWDFGDGSNMSTKKIATHTYQDINAKDTDNYTVKLVVIDIDSGKKSPEDSIQIHVRREPPVVRGLTAQLIGSSLITPVQVNVNAIGAVDPDGKIVSYKWWYYDIKDPDTQLGVQITQSPIATLTIGTKGEEKEKHTYKFGVIATDDDNQKFDSSKDMNDAIIPSLDVTNGPNKAPIAKFNVDHTNIYVGDSVNFASASTDADGTISNYMWNFGTAYTDPGDPQYDKSNVTYTFTKAAKDGVKVRLKVRDNNSAESVSDPVTIFVDSKSGPPTAAFTSKQISGKKVQFTDNSTADTANGANLKSWSWDFDVTNDTNGDGIKDNDIQSTAQNPLYEYPDYGIYRAQLTVNDDQGNNANVTNFVNVKAPAVTPAPAPTQQQTVPAVALQARLLSNPSPTVSDGKIHLQGDGADVTFDFSTSTGTIQTYIIDKNTYFDSNGNGVNWDDEDYKSGKPGTWTTNFQRSWGNIRVRLTVVDTKGNKNYVEKDIVFDQPPAAPGTQVKSQLSAFVLAGYQVVDFPVLLVSIAGFGIFIISALIYKRDEREKEQKNR